MTAFWKSRNQRSWQVLPAHLHVFHSPRIHHIPTPAKQGCWSICKWNKCANNLQATVYLACVSSFSSFLWYLQSSHFCLKNKTWLGKARTKTKLFRSLGSSHAILEPEMSSSDKSYSSIPSACHRDYKQTHDLKQMKPSFFAKKTKLTPTFQCRRMPHTIYESKTFHSFTFLLSGIYGKKVEKTAVFSECESKHAFRGQASQVFVRSSPSSQPKPRLGRLNVFMEKLIKLGFFVSFPYEALLFCPSSLPLERRKWLLASLKRKLRLFGFPAIFKLYIFKFCASSKKDSKIFNVQHFIYLIMYILQYMFQISFTNSTPWTRLFSTSTSTPKSQGNPHVHELCSVIFELRHEPLTLFGLRLFLLLVFLLVEKCKESNCCLWTFKVAHSRWDDQDCHSQHDMRLLLFDFFLISFFNHLQGDCIGSRLKAKDDAPVLNGTPSRPVRK